MGVNGMNAQTSKVHNKYHVMFGDWDENTVRIDFDHTPLNEVKFHAFNASEEFGLDGFLILKSSEKTFHVRDRTTGKTLFTHKVSNYHLVFDRPVSWKDNVRIMNWIAEQCKNESLTRYVNEQLNKKTSTLRLTDTKIVFQYGSQNSKIKKFLENRQFIHDFLNAQRCRFNA